MQQFNISHRFFVAAIFLKEEIGSTFCNNSFNGATTFFNQKHYQDLGSVKSSVWHFCTHYSDAILQGLKWQPRETTAVFSS